MMFKFSNEIGDAEVSETLRKFYFKNLLRPEEEASDFYRYEYFKAYLSENLKQLNAFVKSRTGRYFGRPKMLMVHGIEFQTGPKEDWTYVHEEYGVKSQKLISDWIKENEGHSVLYLDLCNTHKYTPEPSQAVIVYPSGLQGGLPDLKDAIEDKGSELIKIITPKVLVPQLVDSV